MSAPGDSGRPKTPARKFPMSLERLSKSEPRAGAKPPPPSPASTPAQRRGGAAQPVRSGALSGPRAAASPRGAAPAGLGLDSESARRRMAERLRTLGVHDERVLQAMAQVPRHLFVDAALAAQAYEDTSLPIGLNQTISKPSVVARMIELLMGGAQARAAGSLGRVLEIGTGCGYQAAVLARLARSVLSVERLKPLHEKARELLAPIRSAGLPGSAHIRLVYADGMLGHPPNAPYDSIIAAAGGEQMPEAWLEQLAVGGRLVAPLFDAARGGQVIVAVDRTLAGFQRSVHEGVRFVPLKSGVD